jgi:hypothetical protein
MTSEQKEAREERIAIMQADRIPQDTIAAVLRAYAHLYGIEDAELVQGELI